VYLNVRGEFVMRLFRFDAALGREIAQFGSRNAVIVGIQRSEGAFQLGCLHLGAGGVLGRHPAGTRQLLLVVAGEGWVSAGGERRPITVGQAAYWEPGEEHETTTESSLTALILESDTLDPTQRLREITHGE
jgi:quercetin dioxygenase-like cupin family protein